MHMDVQVNFREGRPMLSNVSSFWPLFWGIIGGGALLTVLIPALLADLPAPRRDRRTATVTELRSRRHQSDRHLAATARK